MFGRAGSIRQIGLRLLLLAVLTAFISYQDPAASLHLHTHSGPHAHCCAACHSGQFLAVPEAALTVPLNAHAAWFGHGSAEAQPGNAPVQSNCSRAPPATPSFHLV